MPASTCRNGHGAPGPALEIGRCWDLVPGGLRAAVGLKTLWGKRPDHGVHQRGILQHTRSCRVLAAPDCCTLAHNGAPPLWCTPGFHAVPLPDRFGSIDPDLWMPSRQTRPLWDGPAGQHQIVAPGMGPPRGETRRGVYKENVTVGSHDAGACVSTLALGSIQELAMDEQAPKEQLLRNQ